MRFFLFAIVLLLQFSIQAQEDESIQLPKLMPKTPKLKNTILAFNPGFWAPGLKLEWASANQKISTGFHVRGYIFIFNGVKFDPFVRFYFKKKAPEGAFAQLKFSAGIYDKNSVFFQGITCYTTASGQTFCPRNSGYVRRSDITYLLGGGATFGYQFLLGEEKRFALDVFGGLQIIIPADGLYYGEDISLWLLRGFPLEFGLRLGKAF